MYYSILRYSTVYITVYYSISQYITVYHSILQYITVYLQYITLHTIIYQTHVPPASFLAVTLSASLLPTWRSCLPSTEPTWMTLQRQTGEREKERRRGGGRKGRGGGGCGGVRGAHWFNLYLFMSQKDI